MTDANYQEVIEACALIVESYMGPIETYNPEYRKWMKCAAEIRALDPMRGIDKALRASGFRRSTYD